MIGVRPAAYALIVALLAVASQPYAVRYDVHRFADCNAAALYAAANPTIGRYEYRLAAHLVSAQITSVAPGSFRGQARIAYGLADSQLLLPRWSWPGRTAAHRSAYDDFVAKLTAHEFGHRAIAERAAQNRAGSITVLVRSRQGAERALRAMLTTQLHDLSAELFRKQELYDRVTDHGRRQEDGPLYGFPGGRNVVFSCP